MARPLHVGSLYAGIGGFDGSRYKILGNTLTKNVAEWIGLSIAVVDAGEKLGVAS